MDQKQAQKIRNNVRASQKGTAASRYGQKGLTSFPAKLNSKNLNKVMKYRGLSGQDTKQIRQSFAQKSPMMTRHARKGERFTMTSGNKQASGIYLSKGSLGKTPRQRINRGALPPSNTATKQRAVQLGKNQNLIYGKIGPQPGFQKQDPNGVPRKGGGRQYITNGGFASGAVKDGRTIKGVRTGNYKSAAKTGYAGKVRTAAAKNAKSAAAGTVKTAGKTNYAQKANFAAAKSAAKAGYAGKAKAAAAKTASQGRSASAGKGKSVSKSR